MSFFPDHSGPMAWITAATAGLLLACTGQIARPQPDGPVTPGMGAAGARGTGSSAGAIGTGGASAAPGMQAACAPAPARLWKLTPTQIARTIASVAPSADVAPDAIAAALASTVTKSTGYFRNDAHWRDMSAPHVEQLVAIAEKAAPAIVAHASDLASCAGKTPWSTACAQELVTALGERFFRRPLANDERDRYKVLFDAQASAGQDVALQAVVQAMLLSPSALYRSELGDAAATGDRTSLTAFERASALSYFLTNAPPDAALFSAAKAGQLATKEQLAAHARRLLGSAKVASGFLGYFLEQFDLEHTVGLVKDPKTYPRWTDAVGADMQAETRAFLEHALWNDRPTVATLLTANYSFLNARLADNYGVAGVSSAGALVKTPLPAGRVGLLGQGTFLAAHGKPVDTDIVRRGRFVRERVLCQAVQPPPPNIPPIPPGLDGMTTQRQRLANHTSNPVCAGCHVYIDSLGLAFENFDSTGAFRTQEAGKPIDASGSVKAISASTTTFRDQVGLMSVLLDAPETTSCMASQLFSYASGRVPTDGDACAIANATTKFRDAGGDFKELVVAIVTDDAFIERSK